MTKVFIDGSAGTTGLRIVQRLSGRKDLTLLTLSEALRKDPGARRGMMNQADVVFLCLPDKAAMEAVPLVENPATAVIDTSTAHRTAEGWAYGFPELSEAHRSAAQISWACLCCLEYSSSLILFFNKTVQLFAIM